MNTPTNLSHKSLYSSTPVLTSMNPRSKSVSVTTPPLSPTSRRRMSTRGNLSPLLKSSNSVLLHDSPLKHSPPLSDKLDRLPLSSGGTHAVTNAPPVRVIQQFHNSFYALRLNILIKGQPVELDVTDEPKLRCEQLSCSTSFRPVFSKIQQLLYEFGITGIVQCYSDPQPLIQIAVENAQTLRTLLLNREKIVSYLWVMICNEFINTSTDIGIGLLQGEYRDQSSIRFQLTHRPGNNCSMDLYLISPNSHQREVTIYPVTLANFEHANKLMMSSLIFDFPSAMSSFLISSNNPLQGMYWSMYTQYTCHGID